MKDIFDLFPGSKIICIDWPDAETLQTMGINVSHYDLEYISTIFTPGKKYKIVWNTGDHISISSNGNLRWECRKNNFYDLKFDINKFFKVFVSTDTLINF